ncbi:hypothetical protein G4B88_014153 [Cannabis sativa]|uniref:Uncharacterized protein n=1 Tax=Cannabis sativa TaxID=3483 RepID=A0A7J6I164_CANSA|nr:hypothetical protein G4B88_014153 [Cannabis sativa]
MHSCSGVAGSSMIGSHLSILEPDSASTLFSGGGSSAGFITTAGLLTGVGPVGSMEVTILFSSGPGCIPGKSTCEVSAFSSHGTCIAVWFTLCTEDLPYIILTVPEGVIEVTLEVVGGVPNPVLLPASWQVHQKIWQGLLVNCFLLETYHSSNADNYCKKIDCIRCLNEVLLGLLIVSLIMHKGQLMVFLETSSLDSVAQSCYRNIQLVHYMSSLDIRISKSTLGRGLRFLINSKPPYGTTGPFPLYKTSAFWSGLIFNNVQLAFDSLLALTPCAVVVSTFPKPSAALTIEGTFTMSLQSYPIFFFLVKWLWTMSRQSFARVRHYVVELLHLLCIQLDYLLCFFPDLVFHQLWTLVMQTAGSPLQHDLVLLRFIGFHDINIVNPAPGLKLAETQSCWILVISCECFGISAANSTSLKSEVFDEGTAAPPCCNSCVNVTKILRQRLLKRISSAISPHAPKSFQTETRLHLELESALQNSNSSLNFLPSTQLVGKDNSIPLPELTN